MGRRAKPTRGDQLLPWKGGDRERIDYNSSMLWTITHRVKREGQLIALDNGATAELRMPVKNPRGGLLKDGG